MYCDLSHPIESGMPTYPGDPDVDLAAAATHAADGYAVTDVRMGSHTGTHVDAPRHTEPDGDTLDARDIDAFVYDARLVDVTPRSPRDRIGPDAFPDDLDRETVDLLVVRTGWADRWGDPEYRDHPSLSPAFADRCVEAGVGVAVDALNPDPSPPTAGRERGTEEPAGFPVHHALLGADLPILENLADLSELPERFRLYAFPIPLAAADGAPVRAVAETSGSDSGYPPRERNESSSY